MNIVMLLVVIQVLVTAFAALREKKQTAFEGEKLGYRS